MSNDRCYVAVSGRFLRSEQPTGTQRSARLLLAATISTPGVEIAIHRPFRPPASRIEDAGLSVGFSTALTDHCWEQAIFPCAEKCQVLWSLMGTGPVFLAAKRHVMVVHDLNYLILPHVFGRVFRTWYRFACGAAAQKADLVVCFTNYVSSTIQQRLGISATRIRVIPQGPGLAGLDKPFNDTLPKSSARPYFLCVGSLQPHKNLSGVLAAWDLFRQQHGGYSLKVVGRAQGNFASLGLDLSRLSPDVEFTGYLSDEKLVGLYRGATGFIYPSIEEGFGLPVVESFYCGCPVITSNCSCLPEVAGDAAMLVNPYSAAAIADAMVALVECPTTAQKLRAKGFGRSKLFTWERAGASMSKVLKDISFPELT